MRSIAFWVIDDDYFIWALLDHNYPQSLRITTVTLRHLIHDDNIANIMRMLKQHYLYSIRQTLASFYFQ